MNPCFEGVNVSDAKDLRDIRRTAKAVRSETEEAAIQIAGDIVICSNPGQMLKTWRRRLEVKQSDLAREMEVSPSVLSDYEGGRRASPGVAFVRRYVEALLKIDNASKKLIHGLIPQKDHSAIISVAEFKQPVEAEVVVKLVEAEVLRGKELLKSPIFGYTVLDSIRTIYSLSGLDFYRIFGATTERALIFTKVGLGRSPLVAIRVSRLKPRIVVLHGPKVVDPLALDLAEKERIILALSMMSDERGFAEALSKL